MRKFMIFVFAILCPIILAFSDQTNLNAKCPMAYSGQKSLQVGVKSVEILTGQTVHRSQVFIQNGNIWNLFYKSTSDQKIIVEYSRVESGNAVKYVQTSQFGGFTYIDGFEGVILAKVTGSSPLKYRLFKSNFATAGPTSKLDTYSLEFTPPSSNVCQFKSIADYDGEYQAICESSTSSQVHLVYSDNGQSEEETDLTLSSTMGWKGTFYQRFKAQSGEFQPNVDNPEKLLPSKRDVIKMKNKFITVVSYSANQLQFVAFGFYRDSLVFLVQWTAAQSSTAPIKYFTDNYYNIVFVSSHDVLFYSYQQITTSSSFEVSSSSLSAAQKLTIINDFKNVNQVAFNDGKVFLLKSDRIIVYSNVVSDQDPYPMTVDKLYELKTNSNIQNFQGQTVTNFQNINTQGVNDLKCICNYAARFSCFATTLKCVWANC